MAEGAWVDGPELTGIGGSVLDVAGRLERAASGMETWAYAAQHAVEEAVTCSSELTYAAGSWRATLETLAGEVREFGGDLRKAAEDYHGADAAAAERLRR